jgi:hypothetical protein
MRGSRMTDVDDVVWEDSGAAHRSRLRGAAPAARPGVHRPAPSRPTRDDDRRASRPPRDPGTRDDDRAAFELVIESPQSRDKENARPSRDEADDSRGRRRDGRDDDADDASARRKELRTMANKDASFKRRIGSLHVDERSLRRVGSGLSLTRGSGGSLQNSRRALEAGAFASDSTKREGKLWERDDDDDDDATKGKNAKKHPNRTKKRSFHEKGAVDGGALVSGADWGDETKYSDRPKEAQTWGAFFSAGGVMDRDAAFLRSWDLLTAVSLVFVAIVTPFELGFMETDVESVNGLVLFSVNRLVDLVFFVDIVMQMNTSCVDGAGRVVFSRVKILREYAKGWLWIDLVSIFPFELTLVILTGFKNPDPEQQRLKAVRFLRLLRLLKLLRILRSARIFQRWETRVTLNYAVLSLQKYFATCVLTAHWIGCTLFLTHQLLAPDCDESAIATDRCTFLYAYMDDGRMVDVSVWNQYALAMYFAAGELMGTPFGDLTPVRGEERVFFILCHLVAGFVNAYLVGGMVAAMSAMNAKDERFHQAMDTLNRFLVEKRLTARNPRLCERLRAYYIFKHRVGGDAWGDIVKNTSREMQGEVVQELHGDWLSRVRYFHGVDRFGVKWEVDDEFKLHLSLHVSVVVVAPLEAVFKEDSPVDALYVVTQGLIGCQNRIMRKGDPFGEDVFVYYRGNEPDETSGNTHRPRLVARNRSHGNGFSASFAVRRRRRRGDPRARSAGHADVLGRHGVWLPRRLVRDAPGRARVPRDGAHKRRPHVVRRRRDPRASREEKVRLREARGAAQDVSVAGAVRHALGSRDDAAGGGRGDVRRGHARAGGEVRNERLSERPRDHVPLHASAGVTQERPRGAGHSFVQKNTQPRGVSRRGEPKRFSQTTNQKPSRGFGRDAVILETAGRERVRVRGDARGARHNESRGERVLDVGARDVRITHRAGEARVQSGARFARDGRERFRRRRRGGGPKARRGRGGPRNRARGDGRHRRRRRGRGGKRGVARAGVPNGVNKNERSSETETRRLPRETDADAEPAFGDGARSGRSSPGLHRASSERALLPARRNAPPWEGTRREDVRAPESTRGVQYYLP